MGDIHQINEVARVKQPTEADKKSGRVVNEDKKGSTISGNPIITLPFAVDQDRTASFLLFVDGIQLNEGVGFTFTSIQPNNTSNEITLTDTPGSILPFHALWLGMEQSTIPNAASLAAADTAINTELKNTGQYVRDGFKNFIKEITKIPVPDTEIINRANIVDFENDLRPRMGVERLPIQQIFRIQDELGPNEESVLGVQNDTFDQIRFVTSFWTDAIDTQGASVRLAGGDGDGTQFLEVHFYGTGLNILLGYSSFTTFDMRATVDGGAEGANFIPTGGSSVLSGRNYSSNVRIEVVEGLTQGPHTVKIRLLDNTGIETIVSGIEFVNDTTTIKTNPAKAFIDTNLVELIAQDTQAFDSVFESGTLGSRGGHALMYLKLDQTVKKSVIPTEASQLNLGSADHSNEEIIGKHAYHIFGAGRGDDFSTIDSSTSDRAYTLSDNVTSLVGEDVLSSRFGGATKLGLFPNAAGDFLIFTFVGTGLDIIENGSDITITDNYDVIIDGKAAIGSGIAFFSAVPGKTTKVVSGLPYGTHTFKLLRNASLNGGGISDFVVYGPKTPALPAGAKKISDYFIVADFDDSAVTGTALADNLQMPEGIVSIAPTKEVTYTGSNFVVNLGASLNFPHGHNVQTSTGFEDMEYRFFGEGVHVHLNSGSAGVYTFDARIDGVLTGGATNLVQITDNTGGSYSSTSVVNATPARLTFAGLSLGWHTIKLSKTAGFTLALVSFDIITPIYSPTLALPRHLQSELEIGSNTIADLREFSPLKESPVGVPNIARARGVVIGPSTTSGSFVLIPDMLVQIKTKNNRGIEVNFHATIFAASHNMSVGLRVDGVIINEATTSNGLATADRQNISYSTIVPVGPGVHRVEAVFLSSGGTAKLAQGLRNLTVKEVK